MRSKILLIVFCFMSLISKVWGQSYKTPHLMQYQSVLTDPAGVPVADGMHSVRFRLLSNDSRILFQEEQNLESHNGVISTMVGSANSLDMSMLDPSDAKRLGVQFVGGGPEKLFEITSVPYSLYAEQAFRLADGGISAQGVVWGGGHLLHSAGRDMEHIINDFDRAISGIAANPSPSASPDVSSIFPQVVAMGRVQVNSNADAALLPGAYNTARSGIGGMQAGFGGDPVNKVAVYFSTPLSLPYVVQLTPVGQQPSMYLVEYNENRFVTPVGSFNFVVFK